MESVFETARFVEGWSGPSQDRVEVVDGQSCCVVIVADGAGGTSGGAAAAETVVGEVKTALTRQNGEPTAEDWCALLAAIDRTLYEESVGQSTAVIAMVTPNRVAGASVGDSEAWMVEPNGYRALTEGQRRKPLLGDGAATPVPFAAPYSGTGILVSGTDGLFKYASPHRICDAAREFDLQRALRRLIDSLRLRSGSLQDDVGVAICRPGDRISAHAHSSFHRQDIVTSNECGCFHCLETFKAREISDWIDHGQTALCPKCGIDSVIGSASGYPITDELLEGMRQVWFAV